MRKGPMTPAQRAKRRRKQLRRAERDVNALNQIADAVDKVFVKSIKGHHLPFLVTGKKAAPVLMNVPGQAERFVAIFATREKLEAFLKKSTLAWNTSQEIEDEGAFLGSVPEDMRIIVDPVWTGPESIKFTEIHRKVEG